MSIRGRETSPGSVQELLRTYDRAREIAAELGMVEAVPGRACQGWLRAPIPRPSFLTRWYLSRHIQRSLQDLERKYHSREALGTLGELKDERDSCAEYRQSLRTSSQVVAVVAYVIVALVVAQLLVVKFRFLLDRLREILQLASAGKESVPAADIDDQKMHEALNIVAKTVSGSPATSVDVVDQSIHMGWPTFPAFLALVVVVAYLVTRPLAPAYRLKRQVLCLAHQREFGVRDTAADWFVNKSTGAYDQERRVFDRLDVRPPAEWPIDLIILTAPPALLLAVAGAYLHAAAVGATDLPFWTVAVGTWLAGAGILRITWLIRCARDRRRARTRPPADPSTRFGGAPPYLAKDPDGNCLEGRPPLEVSGLPVVVVSIAPLLVILWPNPGGRFWNIAGALFLASVLTPTWISPTWHRMNVTTERLRRAMLGPPAAHRRRPYLSTALFASVIATPVVLAIELWRLGNCFEEESAKTRLRRLAMLGGVGFGALAWLSAYWLYLMAIDGGMAWNAWPAIFTVVIAGYALLLGVVQHAQNRLILRCGTPVVLGNRDLRTEVR